MTQMGLILALAMCGTMGLANPVTGCGMCMMCEPAPPKPAICAAQPHTADTQFMSLQGYLRWQHYRESNSWLNHEQAVAKTEEETRLCYLPDWQF